MNLLELQILFQQKISDVNRVFEIEQRPDTYTIVNYLNRAIDDYLKVTFLGLLTFEEQIIAIDRAQDNLRYLLVRDGNLTYVNSTFTENWNGRAKRYRYPSNLLVPLSLTTTITRTEIAPMTDQKVFAEFTTRRKAERLIRDSNDRVIHVKPAVFFEDEFYIVVVGDAYVTAITADNINFVRRPDKLSFDYTELSGAASIDITAISTGVLMRALTGITYVDSGGTPTSYKAGEQVTKVAGYDTITALAGEPPSIGYPWGYTDTPDFPDHLHEDLLNRATQFFLEEAKLKLVPNESN